MDSVLVYLVTEEARDTIDVFLTTWGRELADRIHVQTYESLPRLGLQAADAYVFSDLERLPPRGLEQAELVWRALSGLTPAPRLLNRPSRTLRRFDLLQRLRAEGVNSFHAYRLLDLPRSLRYPVFLRYENKHWGPMTDLLHDRRTLDRAVARALLLGHDPSELLLVEFESARGADGIFRKYSAFVIGRAIVPRDIAFSHRWAQRDIDIADPGMLVEERAYLDRNPHADELLRIARIAEIEYARFDYSVTDGRIQVWEANTNPILLQPPDAYASAHLPNQAAAATLAIEALARIAGPQAERQAAAGPRLELLESWPSGDETRRYPWRRLLRDSGMTSRAHRSARALELALLFFLESALLRRIGWPVETTSRGRWFRLRKLVRRRRRSRALP